MSVSRSASGIAAVSRGAARCDRKFGFSLGTTGKRWSVSAAISSAIAVCFFKTGYGSFKEKCYAVRRCVFRKSNGYLKRRSYTGIGHPKTAVVFRIQVWLHTLYRFFTAIANPSVHSVFFRPWTKKREVNFLQNVLKYAITALVCKPRQTRRIH